MRNSLRGLSIALAAGVSLSALSAGAAAQPVPQGDVGQQQSRVDALQSKAESLRQEARQLGGSRDVQTSLRRVEGRIEEFDKHADTLEETAGKMAKSKADLDQLKKEYMNDEFMEDRSSQEIIGDRTKDVLSDAIRSAGGEAVKKYTGPAGRIADVLEEGGKYYFRWRTSSTLEEYSAAQVKNAKDAIESSLISRKTADNARQDRDRLKQIEKEELKVSEQLANEGAKLKPATADEPKGPATKHADLKRVRDEAGDSRLLNENGVTPADPGAKPVPRRPGITPSISFGGGYFEADTPQQFIGRIVDGGVDFAMIYTPGTLDGFYGEAEAQFEARATPYLGDLGTFDLDFRYSDLEGDASRAVEADPAITTGFVFIDPLDPTIPFAVGLGSTNLAWNAHASSSETGVTFKAAYTEYVGLQYGLDGSLSVGLMGDYRSTEHNTRIENLDFAGFAVDENYDFETFGFGPRIEGALIWDCDPDEDGPYPSIESRLRGFIAATYDWRDLDVSQRATGPFFGGFDHRQRVSFDDDGFNFRYGADLTFDLNFDPRTTAFVKVGWQGQSDAPTIIPADGSFAPGLRVAADTQSQDEWYAGVGINFSF